MFHLAAFYSSVADASTYANLAAAADQSLAVDANGNFLLQSDWRLMATHVMGNGVTAARHRAPILQQTFLPEIYPTVNAATVPDSVAIDNYDQSGPMLRKNDPWNIQVSQASGGAIDVWALAWLGDRKTDAPGGPKMKALYSCTATLVKGQWVNGAITTTQQLPSGRYAVVGMTLQGTACYGARLVFVGQNTFRPGVIGQPTYGMFPRDNYFAEGRWGKFGEFDNTAPPSVDIFGLAAGAQTAKIWLDLVKIG